MRPALARALDEIESAAGGEPLPANVKATTLRKLTVAVFRPTSSPAPPPFAVINLHVKNFKDRTRALAAFVVRAQSVVAEELAKAAAADSALPPPPRSVIVAGDMNIDSKFVKGIDAKGQARAVLGAPLGKLPPAGVVKRDALEQFSSELAERGACFAPPIDTLTTLKMRTRFQGQPEKAGDLTVAHRDFIVLPPPSQPPFVLADTVLGGHFNLDELVELVDGSDDAADETELRGDPAAPGPSLTTSDGRRVSNMDLLQPNKDWPGDHCAVLCLFE